jgi:hypothetical protein
MFEGVHSMTTCAFVLAAKTPWDYVKFAGPVTNLPQLKEVEATSVTVGKADFLSWTDTASFPVLPSSRSVSIFQKMNSGLKLSHKSKTWDFTPYTELHANQDRDHFDVAGSSEDHNIPVYKGSSFNLWNPFAGPAYAYADKASMLDYVYSKIVSSSRLQRSPFRGHSFGKASQPITKARIAIRQITQRANSRTVIPCLLPPNVAVTHQACVILNKTGSAIPEAFLLGVLSSIPLDWYSRRLVEGNLTFEILNNLPIPSEALSGVLGNRLVALSSQLAAQASEFKEWAGELGLEPVINMSDSDAEDFVAEIDALVALMFGLDVDEFTEIFATFHPSWNYETRLSKALVHFDNWKDK